MTDQDHKADDAPPADTSLTPEPAAGQADAPDTPPPLAVPDRRRGGGILAPLAGGVLAACIGYGLAHFDLLNQRPAYDDAPLKAGLAAAEAQAKELESQVSALTKTMVAGAESRRAEMQAALEPVLGLPGQIAALSARVDAVDAALTAASTASPDGAVSPAALAAVTGALDALKAQVAALQSSPANPDAIRAIAQEELAAWEATATARLQADAAKAQEAADRAAALTTLQEAARTGAPYAGALAQLGLPDVPEVLTRYADTGLPTAASLAAGFADPARQALEASLRATGAEEGLGSRIWSFLRIQTGARSLTPREGTDPDAVLSRAEAAVVAGDVAAALAELAALPPEGRAPLSDWVALAQDHLSATTALAALSAP